MTNTHNKMAKTLTEVNIKPKIQIKILLIKGISKILK